MQRNRVRAFGAAFTLACLPTVLLTGGDTPQPARDPTISAVPVRIGTLPASDRVAGHRRVPVRARPKPPPPPRPSKPINDFPTGSRTLTLTFDDGPDPRWTPTVLDLLRQYHARAIFCVVGLHVAANPALVRRIAAEGHVLCDHSWTHDEHLRRRSAATIEFEVGQTAIAIKQAGRVGPRYYRAPGGNWSPNVILVAQAHGLKPLGWSVDPADWSKPGTGAIIARVLGSVYPGAVVLMHDGYGDRSQSVAALRAILPALVARGYRFTVPR
jgi:peptidoglycan/xylan/chitin deacetylase (PgdA/CDA1 family)